MIPPNWPSLHFLISDFTGIATAFALFSLLAFFPGYAIGWLLNLFEFRTRLTAFRLAASVPLSIAIAPVTGFTAGRWLGPNAIWFVYAALGAVAFVSGACRGFPKLNVRASFPFLAFMALWLAIAFVALADLPIRHRLYFSIIDFDYSVRIAFTHSIAAFGLPARNPFHFPGHPAVLRYHYFWMIVCAQISRLGVPGVDARTAFIAGAMWTGIGLISLIPLYLRLFFSASQNLLLKSRLGIALLAVTGLDIIPALLMIWLSRIGLISGISPSVEWWNDQVDGWLYTMLWEPHYICSLVACLSGFLLVWTLPCDARRGRRIATAAVAGMAFASATGSGIYVAMIFALFFAIWFAISTVRRDWRGVEALTVAGFTALILIRPFLAGLSAAPTDGASRFPLELTVRAFLPVELLLKLFQLNQPWLRNTTDFLLLPLNYFLEFGVFFVVGRIMWTRFRQGKIKSDRNEQAALLLAVVSIVFCTFVKSTIIANNDLGWRGMLPAQFILLLWAANLLSERINRTPQIRLLIALGFIGVIYDYAILRTYPVLSDLGKMPKIDWVGKDDQVGLRTLANREAYEWIRAHTPETAIIQQNPDPVLQDTFFGAYGQRQALASGGACGTAFGGNPAECSGFLPQLTQLFAGGSPDELARACRTLPVQIILANDTDEAWRDRASWVWKANPAFANNLTRVFTCTR